jgi:hypothetical protein
MIAKTGGTTKNAVGDDYCTADVAISVITIRLISIAFSLLLYEKTINILNIQ